MDFNDVYEYGFKELYHHGIKGMKWGIRKDRLSAKTKSGDTINLKEHPSSRMAKFLAKHSARIAAEQDKTANFDIVDNNGKNVGDLQLYKEAKDSLNIVWLTTKESVRGRGYGTAVMKAAINIARDTGCKQVTLEVPGNSPDARHIYEKLGFKEVASPDRDVNDVWGGLTNMRLDLNDVKHSSLDQSSKFSTQVIKDFMRYLVDEIDRLADVTTGGDNLNELVHHGIKGMKWGVRRYRNTDGSLTPAGKRRYINDKTRGIQKDIDSFNQYRKTGIKTAKGKTVISPKEVDDIINALEQTKRKAAARSGKKYDRVAKKNNANLRSDDAREAAALKKKRLDQMSNAELRKYNERARLEQEYRRLNPSTVKKGLAIAATTAAALGTINGLYSNGNTLISNGKKLVGSMDGVVSGLKLADIITKRG